MVKGAKAKTKTKQGGQFDVDMDDIDIDELENDPTFEAPFEHRVVELQPGADFKAKFGIYEELGRGRFGVVFKVTCITT